VCFMSAGLKICLAVALAVLVGVVCWQARQLSVATQRSAELEQQLAHQAERYTKEHNALQQLQARCAALTQQTASAPVADLSSATPSAATTDSAQPAPPSGPAATKGFLAQMLKDPAMRKMMQEQQERMMKKQYAPLIKQLNLNADQTSQFYAILMDQQSAAMSNGMNILAGGDQAAAAAKAAKDSQADTDSQLHALLGDDGMAQYKDFQEGMVDRMLLEQMTPEFADNPLTPDQQQKLLQTMRTERQNANVPGQADTPTDPTDISGNMSRAMQQQEQVNQQVLQDAAAYLSPAQLQTLGNAQSNFLSMQKAGAAMAQSMFGGSSNSPAQ